MTGKTTGTLHGTTITLDAPVPPLEGRRVRVILESLPAEEAPLAREEQDRLLREWAATGPQGPLEVDHEWPDPHR